ncbi:MAG: flagellar export chaperone FliS [Rouxiella aceris]|uniref:flagellar export chaperone FliS n=1 Tax=Rouxiella aceris TaxID=2703884 RepID=UPI00284A4E5B|nr:flagellar export chaperone FliS [Rouxiella aceris]MDR3432235.1 flagellar export chaperone FliS [Rouxiella aceris]
MGLRKALNAYGNQSLETEVSVASPHRLILMLFDGAIKACNLARVNMQNGAIADKGRAISHAISIIHEGLRTALDKEQGGELAVNLDALYEYMGRQLLQANLHNDPKLIDEVQDLLAGLKESWEQIDPRQMVTQEQVPQQDRAVPLSYGRA